MSRAPHTDWIDYDYALVRVVPHVHLCTFATVGVVLHARTAGFLEGRFHLDRPRLNALCPGLDFDLLERYLDAYRSICQGSAGAGPIGLLPASERFHWLTAPRSAVLQPSEVHAGRTHNPAATLEDLFKAHVEYLPMQARDG